MRKIFGILVIVMVLSSVIVKCEDKIQSIDNSSENLIFSSNWNVQNNEKHFGGDAQYTATGGASVETIFTGREFKWIGHTNKKGGKAEIFIDDVSLGIVNCRTENDEFQRIIFEKTGLAEEEHSLKIVNIEDGKMIFIDVLKVVSSSGNSSSTKELIFESLLPKKHIFNDENWKLNSVNISNGEFIETENGNEHEIETKNNYSKAEISVFGEAVGGTEETDGVFLTLRGKDIKFGLQTGKVIVSVADEMFSFSSEIDFANGAKLSVEDEGDIIEFLIDNKEVCKIDIINKKIVKADGTEEFDFTGSVNLSGKIGLSIKNVVGKWSDFKIARKHGLTILEKTKNSLKLKIFKEELDSGSFIFVVYNGKELESIQAVSAVEILEEGKEIEISTPMEGEIIVKGFIWLSIGDCEPLTKTVVIKMND